MTNHTSVTEFCLLGLSDIRKLQILHFLVFLFAYVASFMGNFLIIVLVTLDHHLHSPMYFFLKNMSFLDLCYISATVLKSMVNAIMQRHSISFHGCFLQLFFFIMFGTAELALLTVMAYDRCLAIFSPLRYRTVMNTRACVQMAAGSWLSGALYSVLHPSHNVLRKKMFNRTTVTEFLLLAFSDVRELQILHFVVFLMIYLAGLMGKLLTITAIAFDQHLHTPLYFFLVNLVILDLGSTSVTLQNTCPIPS
ncbi:olfactory receptor 14I1-like [Gopherus evgoodei]|uniref:olfactory receptor 14I1-like n=1 Tax=Gopherus evgoodei TaxID=1825980 RepID=UPI0011CFF0E0|nr:olfactory receptor 14I1-like [Gopherus evgoodei]